MENSRSLVPPHTDIVKELPSTYKLHYHEDVWGSGNDLIQLDNVRVTKELQDLNLPPYLLSNIQTACHKEQLCQLEKDCAVLYTIRTPAMHIVCCQFMVEAHQRVFSLVNVFGMPTGSARAVIAVWCGIWKVGLMKLHYSRYSNLNLV